VSTAATGTAQPRRTRAAAARSLEWRAAEHGGATLVGLALSGLVLMTGVVAVNVGALVGARAAVQTAADMAALAALTPGHGDPPSRAAEIAAANGAELVMCACSPVQAVVRVRRRVRLVPGGLTASLTAAGRAVLSRAVPRRAVRGGAVPGRPPSASWATVPTIDLLRAVDEDPANRSLGLTEGEQTVDLHANASAAAGEHLSGHQVAGVGVSVVGIGLAFVEPGRAIGGDAMSLVGDGLLLLTGLLGALYGLIAKRVLAVDNPAAVTTYAMLFGTLVLLPIALAEGMVPAVAELDWQLLGLVVFLGVLGGAAAFFLWTWALSRITTTQVAVYVNLNPIVAALLGIVLLGERRSPIFLLGFAAVVAGVLLVNWPGPQRS
jgi:secretion/DNA translocation related TadE-like protein